MSDGQFGTDFFNRFSIVGGGGGHPPNPNVRPWVPRVKRYIYTHGSTMGSQHLLDKNVSESGNPHFNTFNFIYISIWVWGLYISVYIMYSLHSPLYEILILWCLTQLATLNAHGLAYVLSSVPQTGSEILVHVLLHIHLAVPFCSAHIASNPHFTNEQGSKETMKIIEKNNSQTSFLMLGYKITFIFYIQEQLSI